MGLGGAFVALADDATAAFANPAGLVQLLQSEVSLELRRREYSTSYTEGGRAQGEPTGWGIDTVDGV
jgi:long-subunit fatty acid transport protein